MASGAPPRSARDAREPAGDGVVWHSTCGYPACVEPSRYAADSTCKGCRRIKYCTHECQMADWKRHKRACQADEAADEAEAREGALVVLGWTFRPPPRPEYLCKAALLGNLRDVYALLRLGADVNSAGRYGASPLNAASKKGHAAVVVALLASSGIAVNAVDMNGAVALCLAAEEGHVAVTRALLSTPGVIVNSVLGGCTPLCWATSCKSNCDNHALIKGMLKAAGGLECVHLPRKRTLDVPIPATAEAADVEAHNWLNITVPVTTRKARRRAAGAGGQGGAPAPAARAAPAAPPLPEPEAPPPAPAPPPPEHEAPAPKRVSWAEGAAFKIEYAPAPPPRGRGRG